MIDIEIEKPNITPCDKNESGSIGEFVVEPLERGYGITLGNSLRRILLGSLAGYAATSIKIDGVLHEISTVDGVKEDVPEIVLNVKGIIAKLHTAGPKTVIIDKVGPCTVTAGDIIPDADIEILNPSQHLATVSENARFYMELTFDSGRGYVSQDKNKADYIAVSGGVGAPKFVSGVGKIDPCLTDVNPEPILVQGLDECHLNVQIVLVEALVYHGRRPFPQSGVRRDHAFELELGGRAPHDAGDLPDPSGDHPFFVFGHGDCPRRQLGRRKHRQRQCRRSFQYHAHAA